MTGGFLHKIKVLKGVIIDNKTYATKTKINHKRLLNFDVTAAYGDKTINLLFLDNYGVTDLTGIPKKFCERFFNSDGFNFTVAINKDTGLLYIAVPYFKKNFVCLDRMEIRIPKEYLKKLDIIRSEKRPFGINCDSRFLWGFIERESSLGDLQRNVIVQLNFGDERLDVISGSYNGELGQWRAVSKWTV